MIEPEPPDQLTVEEVKSRAVHGTATLGARSLITFGLGVVANLVLARLLVPHDFGLVALGTTLITVVRFMSESGFGAALIGRAQPPQRDELAGLLALQLAVTIAIAGGFAAVAGPLGREAQVPAVMLIALPLASLRLPTALVLERNLSYRTIATAEVVEALAGYTWAIATVAGGWGVWGLATAAPVRTLIGSVVMVALGPLGFLRPRWAWTRIRPLLSFGLRFQATQAVIAARDQGLNVGIAAVGGIATLGLWSLAFAAMQVPFLLFFGLWRVSYPAISRLLEAGEDARPVVERAIGVVAVAMSPVLVGIIAGADALLPALIGERWSGSASILVWASVAMIVHAPVSVPGEGYLLATGRVSKVLLAVAIGAVAWLLVALPLLRPVGPSAIGLGWLAMAVVEAGLFARWVTQASGARVISELVRPVVVALAAGAGGLSVASLAGDDALGGICGVIAAELLLVGGLLALARGPLRATLGLRRRLRQPSARASSA